MNVFLSVFLQKCEIVS